MIIWRIFIAIIHWDLFRLVAAYIIVGTLFLSLIISCEDQEYCLTCREDKFYTLIKHCGTLEQCENLEKDIIRVGTATGEVWECYITE